MSKRQKVHVVITGGTIDSEWNPSRDTAVTAAESVVPKYFERLELDLDLTFKTVCMKDSRELLPEDIREICRTVDQSPADKVLITHGTYTMPDTARFLEANMKTKKAVVLTGSITPLRGYDMSDAAFNLGFSLASLLNMKRGGVLLSMQGRLFKPQEVAKNLAQAQFFSIEQ